VPSALFSSLAAKLKLKLNGGAVFSVAATSLANLNPTFVSATLSLSFDGFVSFASAVSFSEAEEETGVGAVGVRAPGDDDGDNEALGAAFGRDLRPVT
jgi:hypothetical protein